MLLRVGCGLTHSIAGPLASTADKNADAFHDITTGVNCGINAGPKGCDDGFHAIAGWDAVTGVGSPNYLELVKRL